jgi:hypothetical protein
MSPASPVRGGVMTTDDGAIPWVVAPACGAKVGVGVFAGGATKMPTAAGFWKTGGGITGKITTGVAVGVAGITVGVATLVVAEALLLLKLGSAI